MSRYRAAFYHFLVSLVVFIGLAYLVLVRWYPDFFFAIDGGWEGLRIIIGVDLVLGPLLTLIVYRAGKKGLLFDLILIALIQTSCLAAGVWVVYEERPLFFVFYDKHFYSNSADSYSDYGVIAPDPAGHGDSTPVMVAAHLSDDPIEEANLRRVLYQTRTPAWVYPQSYEPLADHMAEVLASGASESRLRELDADNNLDPWLAKYGGTVSDYAFVPIHSRYRKAYLGIRRSDQALVDIVEIYPRVEPDLAPSTPPGKDQ